MSAAFDPVRFHKLLVRYWDRTLSDADAGEFHRTLVASPAAQDLFQEFCLEVVAAVDNTLSLDTEQASAAGAVFRVSVVDEGAKRSRRPASRRRVLVGAVGLAAAVAVAVFVARVGRGASADGVARLTTTAGADWEDTGMPTAEGSPLPPGRLVLKAGLARVDFGDGAAVVIQGPADFRIESPKKVHLDRGKLRAVVPPRAVGFAVGTPRFDVIDRGTEFAVWVKADDGGEVHVFQGMVEVFGAGGGSGRPLTAGAAERWDTARPPAAIPAAASEFVSAQELDVIRAKLKTQYDAWMALSRTMVADPTLLVYYPFNRQSDWGKSLVDASLGGGRNGTVVDATWAEGRWPDKKSLAFTQRDARVVFYPYGEYDSLTLAAWVRLDQLDQKFAALMTTNEWEEGSVHWQIKNTGTVTLGVRGAKTEQNYETPPVLDRSRLGQWVHLAAAYDATKRTVTHFVDGKTVAADALKFDTRLKFQGAGLGNWATRPDRALHGRIDEFVMFSRAFTEEGVRKMFEVGKPSP